MKKLTYIFLVVAFLFTSTVGTIPVAQAVNKDYRLIKTGDNPMVYLVKNDRRIHIPNEEVFEAGGYSWGDIEIIPEKEMVSIPNTGLIKSKIDSKVYAITDGKKEWIPDEETFLDSDYEWEDIVLINEAQINFYPDTQKAGNKNQPTKITLSDTSEQKKDVVKKKEKRTYNLGSGNGGGGNSLTVPFTPTESDKVTIQNEEPEIVVDKEEVVAEKPRKDIVNVAQTDWSKVDWDEKTVLLSDLDKYKEKIDLLLEKGDGTQAKNLKPERHTMSSDEALEELSVPSKVSEIVKEYREKTGMFQKIKDEKNAKKILGAYIKSATPEVPKMEKKVNEMDHFVDISTQGKKMKGVELKPFSGKEKPEIKVEIKSKFEKVKRHRLEDVTIRGIEKKVKTRGLSLSVSVKTNEEKTLGKKILSYFGKLFGIEEVVAEDVTPIIEYYNGIEANTLDNALYYLSLIQNDDGTFGNITKYEETAEVALMLGDIRRTDNTQFNDALNYLIAEEPKNNREKAIKARLMVGLGLPYESYLNELVVDKNDNHGYPLHSGYQSDILTSMETVLAMYTGNYSIQGEMPLALYYVLNNIPEDGALRYTPNSLPSYYLINKIAQYLQPFRSMNIANDEGVDISVQDKIDNLLGYLSSQFDLENEKLLGTDDTIDEIMTFRTWQMYGVENNYQEILEEKLIEDQYVNGSFDNSTRATTYSVKALQKPDLVLTNFVSTGNLESRQAANFELTIENRGHAPSVGGTIYLFTDNCDTGTRLELDPSAFTVEPNQTVNLGINISETNRLTQDVNFKLYYENSEDLNYDNNWIQEDFNFVAASDGTPALPMYYAAFKYELNNNPAVIVTLPALRKDDPNRGAYALLYKESSNSQWGYTNYDPNLYIIGYFPEGGYYDFRVGVWNAEMTQITYFTDYTSIHLSADDELYTGSVRGRLTLDNENFPDEYITMQSGLSGSTDENGEFNRSGGANGRLATWVEEEYYDEIRTTFTVIEGQTTENIRIFTHLKEDNEAPEIGFFELRWLNNMVARTEGEYTLFAASSDNVKVKDADFYLWHPQEEYWEYLGNDATYGDTKTLEWYIPSDLPLGTDYKVRAISYDYRGNASEPVEWGPFEVINGIPPEVEVLFTKWR